MVKGKSLGFSNFTYKINNELVLMVYIFTEGAFYEKES